LTADLDSEHRDTLKRIFSHPSSGNIEWRQVRALLEAVGTATEEHNGKLRVTLGDETEVLQPPRGKDIDEQMIVDLRRMLRRAAWGSETLSVAAGFGSSARSAARLGFVAISV
jgi:hypothetical protein